MKVFLLSVFSLLAKCATGFALHSLLSSSRRSRLALHATTTSHVRVDKVTNVALLQSNPIQKLARVASLVASSAQNLLEEELGGDEEDLVVFPYSEEIDETLKQGWRNFQETDAYVISLEESSAMDTQSAQPSTYGEITPRGARQLFGHMNLYDTDHPDMDDGVVFLDLGSGTGKLVVQAYMEIPALSQSMGVEMAPSRHNAAVRGWETIKKRAQAIRGISCEVKSNTLPINQVTLLQGDMFDVDMHEVTHVYISSPCFGSAMMDQLAIKLATEAPQLVCVATVQRFPEDAEMFLGEPHVKLIEQSWSGQDLEEVHLYWPGW